MAKRLELEELAFFCDDLSTMYASGVATDEALLQMRDDAGTQSTLASVLPSITQAVSAGVPLYEALDGTDAFPPDMPDMLEVGEKTGRTDRVLAILAARYRREAAFLAHFRSAILFPTVLQLVVVLVLLALTFWVIPVFADVYEGLAAGLVSSSFDYMGCARVICYIALVVALIVLICLFVLALVVSVKGRSGLAAAGLLVHLPGMKRAGQSFAASNLLALLNLFVASGVPAGEAIDQVSRILRDEEPGGTLSSLRSHVDEGSSLGDALREAGVVDALRARRVANAERAGSLEDALAATAAELEVEAIESLDGVVAAVEPSISIVLAVVVGAALVAVMLPLVGIMGGIG